MNDINYFLQLIEDNSNDEIEKAFDKGKLYKKFKNYLEASKEFSKAIMLHNKYFEAFNERALCYLALNKYDLSILDCNKAIEISTDDIKKALVYEVRSRAYIEKEDYINALSDLNKSCEITFSEAFDRRGILHFKLENYYEALLDFNQMDIMFPENGYYKFKMGLCYYKLDEFDNAIDVLNKSKKLGFIKATDMINKIKLEIRS